MRDPPIPVSKPDPVYEFTLYTSAMHRRFSCAGNMDYPRALVKAMAEYPWGWNFSNWNCVTDISCSPGEKSAIHENGVGLQRRKWEIVL